MVLTLYNLDNSRSFRVHWLVNELKAPVKIRNYERIGGKKADASMGKDAGYKLGKSPLLVEDGDGDKAQRYEVPETGNCLIHLIERFEPDSDMLPSTRNFPARTKCLYLVEFAESMMTHGLPKIYAMWFMEDPDQQDFVKDFTAKLQPNLNNDMDELERTLEASGGPYMLGRSITLADFALGFSVEFLLSVPLLDAGVAKDEGRWPHVRKWLKTIEGRPAYQETLKNGAKYDFCVYKQ